METDDVEKKVIQRKQEEICMGQKKVCVGVVGAGAISDIYLKNMIHRFENLYVKSICAAHLESAQKKAQEYGIQAVTMEEMFDDPEIRMIVNLTPAHVHYSVIRAALEHGKHVYTEKTLTDDINKSAELVRLAKEKTVILISHRLANVVGADRIYTLEDGRISQCGTHTSLLNTRGVYSRLFNSQSALENYCL